MKTRKNIQVPVNARNFLLAENLLAPQESLCSMELSSLLVALSLYQDLYINAHATAFLELFRIIKVTRF
jgi:hypothetical protein